MKTYKTGPIEHKRGVASMTWKINLLKNLKEGKTVEDQDDNLVFKLN